MFRYLDVPFEVLGDGEEVGSFHLHITLDFVAGEPEYIPPYERPNLYEPGSAPDWRIVALKVDGEETELPCFWGQMAERWVEANIDQLHHYEG